jgi:hypothetical protein
MLIGREKALMARCVPDFKKKKDIDNRSDSVDFPYCS